MGKMKPLVNTLVCTLHGSAALIKYNVCTRRVRHLKKLCCPLVSRTCNVQNAVSTSQIRLQINWWEWTGTEYISKVFKMVFQSEHFRRLNWSSSIMCLYNMWFHSLLLFITLFMVDNIAKLKGIFRDHSHDNALNLRTLSMHTQKNLFDLIIPNKKEGTGHVYPTDLVIRKVDVNGKFITPQNKGVAQNLLLKIRSHCGLKLE